MRTAMLAAVALAAALTTACTAQPSAAPSESATPRPAKSVTLTFGVSGDPEMVASYRKLAADYKRVAPNVTVNVQAWPDDRDLANAVRDGEDLDVMLAPRSAITGLAEARRITPVDTPLETRDVDFGDSYSREAIEDFSVDRRLECMPYSVSPSVVYVNSRLVDFAAMAKASLPAPKVAADGTVKSWSLDQFTAAMAYATRNHPGVQGVWVDPSVTGMAPWLAGNGVTLFDTSPTPTSTTLSAASDQVSDVVTALNEPGIRAKDLHGQTPAQAFAAGKIAAYVGSRSDLPQLRADRSLQWKVMTMPGGKGTTGEYSGLCLSSQTDSPQTSADFLAYLISKPAVEQMVRTGRFVPVNSAVGYSTVFTQPYAQPANARVFTDTVRYLQVLPSSEELAKLQQVVGGPFKTLTGLTDPAALPSGAPSPTGTPGAAPSDKSVDTPDPDDQAADLTARIDELSKQAFPQPSPSPSP